MSTATPRTAVSTLLARCLALAAIAAVGLALITAAAAHADVKSGGGGSRGCAVEDEHGNVTYVPVGTHYLLFTCGSDGEWHFGWLITEAKAPPTKGIGGGTTVTTTTGGVTQAPVAMLKASATTTPVTTAATPHRRAHHRLRHRKHTWR